MVRESSYAFAVVLTTLVYISLDIPLITWLRSSEEAGVYRSSQSILSIIMPILTILQLLVYPRLLAWKNHSREMFLRRSLTLTVGLGALAAALSISALIWVPLAYELLLGPAFLNGIWPCILLVLAKSLVLVSTVPTWGVYALDLDRKFLAVTACAAMISILSNLLLIPRIGIVAAAATSVMSEAVILVGASAIVYRYIRSWSTIP
jgi:O-antigen/teichoic acid export membrane protein